uniref:Uncharacterized protein n=1 Tax=Trypanosoma vivax (strain Y486) TaxID=1055687 RepID=G0TZ74_TRYVY|nr:hypothetical protein TVY486_0705970 [Trypanosoma vivax Y486]
MDIRMPIQTYMYLHIKMFVRVCVCVCVCRVILAYNRCFHDYFSIRRRLVTHYAFFALIVVVAIYSCFFISSVRMFVFIFQSQRSQPLTLTLRQHCLISLAQLLSTFMHTQLFLSRRGRTRALSFRPPITIATGTFPLILAACTCSGRLTTLLLLLLLLFHFTATRLVTGTQRHNKLMQVGENSGGIFYFPFSFHCK